MDFVQLFKDGIISRTTLDWLKPLLQKEQTNAREVQDEAARRSLFDFGEQSDDEEEEDGNDMIESGSLSLHGIMLPYVCDGQSTGHGNRVWQASIATCLYLGQLHFRRSYSPTQHSEERQGPLRSSLKSIEFGAGTAIPSLFLAHLLSNASASSSSDASSSAKKPLIHITDGRQYRNVRQILLSVSRQKQEVREAVHFRVSPHNWGEGVGSTGYKAEAGAGGSAQPADHSFFDQECYLLSNGGEMPHSSSLMNSYDVVVVSDCIYNPNYHDALIESIAATLKFPDTRTNNGGRAVVSFSLHGNTSDDTVWNFLHKITARRQHVAGGGDSKTWRLQALAVESLTIPSTASSGDYSGKDENGDSVLTRVDRGGWNMEEKMKQLGLWAANLDPKRWIAYVYEVTWILAEA